jgi:chitin synthase
MYAFWKFDDFSWGDTRKTAGEKDKGHGDAEGEFDSTKITMKRWRDFEKGMFFFLNSLHGCLLIFLLERRLRSAWSQPHASTDPYPSQYETYSHY